MKEGFDRLRFGNAVSEYNFFGFIVTITISVRARNILKGNGIIRDGLGGF